MTDEVIVDPDLLEADAEEYWQAGADELAAMEKAIPVVAATDFSAIPRAQEAAQAYLAASGALAEYIRGGVGEYLAFEHALLESALEYERAHEGSRADIARLLAELAS